MENEDRLFKLFDQARNLSGAERERFLRNCCGDDPDMEEQVVSLVQAAESAGDFPGGTLVPPNLLLTEKPGEKPVATGWEHCLGRAAAAKAIGLQPGAQR